MLERGGEILVVLLILAGSFFLLVGAIGLVKLPSLEQRLHAPTKATTLGVGGVLLASILFFTLETGRFSVHELLVTLFLFLTAPVSANMIAKAHLHQRRRAGELPPTGRPVGWSTFDSAATEPVPPRPEPPSGGA